MAEFSWTDWHTHPSVIAGLLALTVGYLLAVGPLRQRFGWAEEVNSTKVIAFLAGVFVLFVALLSPLHELGDNYLFSAHMIQHLLLILVAPPLLLLGTPDWLLRPLIRPRWIMATVQFLTKPVVAFFLVNVIFAMWHVPALYDLTLESREAHVIEHLMFIVSGFILWLPILSPMPELPRSSYLIQTVYLFLQPTVPSLLGAIIAFSDRILYSGYAVAPRVWDLSPKSDQQLGGLIMWVPGGLAFLLTVVIVFLVWANQEEAKNRQPARGLEKISLAK